MNYEQSDTFGMYKVSYDGTPGPDVRVTARARHDGGAIPSSVTTSLITRMKNWATSKRSCSTCTAAMSVMRCCLSVGFLGMGEKLFAVPWNALKLDTENKRFILNVEK